MKIMVVDDDELVRELVRDILHMKGYRNVALADSADEAEKLIGQARIPFDCFFLDIQMPGRDGIELCGWIKSQPAYAKAPVVMLTVLSDISYVDRAFAAGAFDYATKPIVKGQIHEKAATIRRLIEGQKTLGPQAVPALAEAPRPAGMIDYLALENYVKRLSLAGLFTRQIFAFKIVALNHRGLPHAGPQFDRIVDAGARAIIASLAPRDLFLAHAGDGVLLCVARSTGDIELEKIAEDANARFAEARDAADVPHDLEVTICVGHPIRVGQVRSGRTALHSLNLAIRSATRAAQEAPMDNGAAGYYGRRRVAAGGRH
ncbi:response regulator [Solirhodobacter olei]|uniref:response regulator n=1 Tax=Solirhodobacter olei TaxID=2493082 RepID=UPI000FDC141B|nr:response regulator [Solirhodobacter olei]